MEAASRRQGSAAALWNPPMPSWNLAGAPRWALDLLGLLGAVLALHLGQTILIPTVIALLLAAMLWPVVRWMNERLYFSWTFACLLAIAGLVALNLFVTLAFFASVSRLVQEIPDVRSSEGQQRIYAVVRERLSTFMTIDPNYLPAEAEDSKVFNYIKETLGGPYIARALLQIGEYSNSWIWQWVLVMFLLLFLLLEGPMLSRRFLAVFGTSPEARAKAGSALAATAHHVRGYLLYRTMINFGLALLVLFVYTRFFELKQAAVWALVTAVLFYVPYIGPLVAGIGPVLDAFFTQSPLTALAVIGVYTVIVTVEGYFLVPVVMGHTMELNATTVMLSCLFWDLVWGLPGLFLAMPLMAAVKAACSNIPSLRPVANLMSTHRAELTLAVAPAERPVDQTQILTADDLKALDIRRRVAEK